MAGSLAISTLVQVLMFGKYFETVVAHGHTYLHKISAHTPADQSQSNVHIHVINCEWSYLNMHIISGIWYMCMCMYVYYIHVYIYIFKHQNDVCALHFFSKKLARKEWGTQAVAPGGRIWAAAAAWKDYEPPTKRRMKLIGLICWWIGSQNIALKKIRLMKIILHHLIPPPIQPTYQSLHAAALDWPLCVMFEHKVDPLVVWDFSWARRKKISPKKTPPRMENERWNVHNNPINGNVKKKKTWISGGFYQDVCHVLIQDSAQLAGQWSMTPHDDIVTFTAAINRLFIRDPGRVKNK